MVQVETMECRRCGGTDFCKDGFVGGRQRYLCKKCQRHQIEVDGRAKYPDSDIKKAISLYLDGFGIRCIARIFTLFTGKAYTNSTILRWIRKEGLKVESRQQSKQSIEVCEMDELYTYVKKTSKLEYGLLWIGTGCVLLHLKADQDQEKFAKDFSRN